MTLWEIAWCEQPNAFPILRATGYAIISKQPGPSQDEKTLQAMRASKLDAYRELSEQVYGQNLIADTTLRDNIQKRNKNIISLSTIKPIYF